MLILAQNILQHSILWRPNDLPLNFTPTTVSAYISPKFEPTSLSFRIHHILWMRCKINPSKTPKKETTNHILDIVWYSASPTDYDYSAVLIGHPLCALFTTRGLYFQPNIQRLEGEVSAYLQYNRVCTETQWVHL